LFLIILFILEYCKEFSISKSLRTGILMENNDGKSVETNWKEKIKDHWKALILIIAAIVVLCVVAVIVVIWHIQTTPIGNYGLATFDQWSLDWIVGFTIVLTLWELLFVGLPGGIFFCLGGYIWWKQLPADEKNFFKAEEKKSHKARNASGGGGFFLFIAFCIYMLINGGYYVAFGSQPYSYWIFSYMQMMVWLLIIFGIPIAVGGLLYLRYWLNKP